ncbi:uncharacterized protein METZ01_LOCUS244307, partial [marine metagenome]
YSGSAFADADDPAVYNSSLDISGFQVDDDDASTSGGDRDSDFRVTPIDFEDYVYDADGDDLSIVTIPPSSDETLTTIFGGTLTPSDGLEYDYSPPANSADLAADFLLFKASDGQAQSSMAFGTFNFTDGRWQDRFFVPTALSDNVNIEEDNEQEISFVGFDPVFQSIYQNDDGIEIIQYPTNGSLGDLSLSLTSTGMLAVWEADYSPDPNFSGSDEIRFEVTSPSGTSSAGIISITVYPVNDLPIIDNISDVSMDEDDTYSFSVNYSDVDDVLSASVSSNSDDVIVSIDSGTGGGDGYVAHPGNAISQDGIGWSKLYYSSGTLESFVDDCIAKCNTAFICGGFVVNYNDPETHASPNFCEFKMGSSMHTASAKDSYKKSMSGAALPKGAILTFSACNFNENASDSGDCIYAVGECESCSGATNGTGTIINGDTDGDGNCD